MVLPLESESGAQVLTRIVKKDGRPIATRLLDVRFVPMTGKARHGDDLNLPGRYANFHPGGGSRFR